MSQFYGDTYNGFYPVYRYILSNADTTFIMLISKMGGASGKLDTENASLPIFRCPAQNDDPRNVWTPKNYLATGYGISARLTPTAWGAGSVLSRDGQLLNQAKVPQPGSTRYIADCCTWPNEVSGGANATKAIIWTRVNQDYGLPTQRHTGKINILYLDSHVGNSSIDECRDYDLYLAEKERYAMGI